jgi:hypothetical protein
MKLSAFFFSSVAIAAVSSAAVSDDSENNKLIGGGDGVLSAAAFDDVAAVGESMIKAAATAVDGESVKTAAAHNNVLRGAIKAIAEVNTIAVGKLFCVGIAWLPSPPHVHDVSCAE